MTLGTVPAEREMYAGHLGFALGTYSFRRTVPLWLLLFASELPDWFDVGLCVAHVDRGPWGLYTHGLLAVGAAAVLLAGLYAAITSDVIGGGAVALTVASHYALDYLTGVKPTWPGGPSIGLHLYQYPMVDFVLEGATILIGWWLYRRTVPAERRQTLATYGVLGGLVMFQLGAAVAFILNMGGAMKC